MTTGAVDSQELRFAERFTQAWRMPTPAALVDLLHEDVQLYQPHRAPIRGKAQALAEFQRLLGNLPGLHGVVTHACGADGVVYIEWRMILPGTGNADIGMVDRFLLRDGLALERRVYFDQLALLSVVATRPGLWAGFLRYRFGRQAR